MVPGLEMRQLVLWWVLNPVLPRHKGKKQLVLAGALAQVLQKFFWIGVSHYEAQVCQTYPQCHIASLWGPAKAHPLPHAQH